MSDIRKNINIDIDTRKHKTKNIVTCCYLFLTRLFAVAFRTDFPFKNFGAICAVQFTIFFFPNHR